ncbi:MAG: SDR family oxidoreductase [Gammaproteobacteria bacterium]
MPTILITGANRGLGLEFTRQYAQAGWQIFACCREPEEAHDLIELSTQDTPGSIEILPLDVTQSSQIDTLAEQLADQPLDILLNNAGVIGSESKRLGELKQQLWLDVFTINTIAPVLLAQALVTQLKQGMHKKIVNISTRMGSIADNDSGGYYSYRSSKAALNAAMKSLSIDLHAEGISVLLLHPGWVKTRMGGENALVTPEQSVSGMRHIIETTTLKDSGRFLAFDGRELSW